MKKLTLITAFCLLAFSLSAQVDFGIKAGLNLTNVTADILTDDYQIKSSNGSEIGYHAGAFLRASMIGIFIQPELLFTSVASEFTVTDVNTNIETLGNQRIGRIDVPLIIGAKLGTLRLGLGPVASFIVSEKSDLTDLTGYETTLKSATFGWQLGAGMDVWKLGFDIRYEGSLSQLGDEIIVGGTPLKFDSRARQLIFSVSFRF